MIQFQHILVHFLNLRWWVPTRIYQSDINWVPLFRPRHIFIITRLIFWLVTVTDYISSNTRDTHVFGLETTDIILPWNSFSMWFHSKSMARFIFHTMWRIPKTDTRFHLFTVERFQNWCEISFVYRGKVPKLIRDFMCLPCGSAKTDTRFHFLLCDELKIGARFHLLTVFQCKNW